MSATKLSLVAIDDDPQALRLLSAALANADVDITTAATPQQGLDLVHKLRPAIVITDLKMPGMSGIELLERVLAIDRTIDVVLLTGHFTSESAVEAIQKGAADYLEKPVNIVRLRERIASLAEDARKRSRVDEIEDELLRSSQFEGIIGRSPSMLEVFRQVKRIAPYFRTALITGASGTGKELMAKSLHHLSPAAGQTFAVFNCGAITETLAESELFGHVKGSFTGATSDRAGIFEHANGGTVFLDEIGELSPSVQAKLLRVIQQGEIQKVGAPGTRKVSVRIIGATHRDLRGMVAERTFREDLFFRLSMVEVRLPTLAERREDISLLIRHFVKQFATAYGKPLSGLTPGAEALLMRHHWPGNIRELENVLGYAAMMAQGFEISEADLPVGFVPGDPGKETKVPLLSLDDMCHVHARRVLDQLGGDKVKAAEVLGVSRATLYRLLAEHDRWTSRHTASHA